METQQRHGPNSLCHTCRRTESSRIKVTRGYKSSCILSGCAVRVLEDPARHKNGWTLSWFRAEQMHDLYFFSNMSNGTSLSLHATEKVQDAYVTRRAAEALKHLCNKSYLLWPKRKNCFVFLFLSRLDGAPFSGLGSSSRSFCRQIGGGRPEGQ